MSKRYWEEVITSDAVNAVAARVTSGGFKYEPMKNIQTKESDTPLPIKALSCIQEDLSGRRFGRLIALGPYAEKKKRWVCRCGCGTYVVRTARSVKNKNNFDACEHCRHLMDLRVRDIYRRTGRDVDWRDL